MEALLRQTACLFGEYAELAGGVLGGGCAAMVLDSRDPGALADFIAQNCDLRYHEKQEILEELHPSQRLKNAQRASWPGRTSVLGLRARDGGARSGTSWSAASGSRSCGPRSG